MVSCIIFDESTMKLSLTFGWFLVSVYQSLYLLPSLFFVSKDQYLYICMTYFITLL